MRITNFKRLTVAAAAGALISTAALAYTFETPSLTEQMDNNVVYVTGGVGEDERAELQVAKKEYSLQVLNTTRKGAYVSDVSIIVQNKAGDDVMVADAGPILLAKLPAGKYNITAQYNSLSQTKHIMVGKAKPTTVQFTWNDAD